MSSPTPRSGSALQRRFKAVTTVGALMGVTSAMRWSVGYPLPLARSLAGAATFDQLLVAAIALMAWLVFGWACVVVTIELAAAIPGALGRQFANLADVVTPTAVRKFAQAAIGLSILAGPVTAGNALAADAGDSSSSTRTAIVATSNASPSPSSTPSPSPSPSSTPSRSPSPSRAPLVPLDRPTVHDRATLDLDRPTPPVAAPTTSPSAAALAAGVPHREATTLAYVVHRGDALWDVAARHLGPRATAADIAREWPKWYAANRAVIGPDPNVIHPGDLLVPPSS